MNVKGLFKIILSFYFFLMPFSVMGQDVIDEGATDTGIREEKVVPDDTKTEPDEKRPIVNEKKKVPADTTVPIEDKPKVVNEPEQKDETKNNTNVVKPVIKNEKISKPKDNKEKTGKDLTEQNIKQEKAGIVHVKETDSTINTDDRIVPLSLGNYKYSRIPGIKLPTNRKSEKDLSRIVTFDDQPIKDNVSGKTERDKNKILDTKDVPVEAILALVGLIILIIIVYKFRSKGQNKKVLRSFPK